MLKIVSHPKYATTVDIRTLHLVGTLAVVFVALGQAELRSIETQAAADGKSVQHAVLGRVLASHEAVEIDGEQLAFGAGSLDRLLDYPGIGPALLRRYYESLWEEASGNSEPPPSGS